jgi:predicted nucleic acid-binding protein
MIVVDATVVPFLFLEGEMTQAVRDLHALDPGWVTPPILNHEILHLLSKLGVAEGHEPMERLWREIRSILSASQQVPDPVRSLRLGIDHGLSGYEAQYLCLAESLNIPLITEETRLQELSPKRAFGVMDYLRLRG